ncbi:MAG: hypothetical protein GFH26_640181n30 [Chloroflexi bacterium AL-N15]|nr:hypothetical protein [Chloroflexi bacterium AL-N15]
MHHLVTYWRGLRRSTRRTLLSLSIGALLMGGLYTGYCWGGFGRNVLPLQYLLQCRCPPASEAVRYRHFTVLAPACHAPEVHTMSPSGRTLVIETHQRRQQVVRIDLLQQHQTLLPFDTNTLHQVYAIDDYRFFVRLGWRADYQVYDLQTATTTPVNWVFADEQDARVQRILRQAAEVWVFEYETLALANQYQQAIDNNIVLYTVGLARQAQVNEQLTADGIDYEILTPPYQAGALRDTRYSPDGRFYTREDGIYDATTRERLLDTDLPRFQNFGGYQAVGWVAGQRGIVYAAWPPYLLDNRDDLLFSYTWLPVHQPVLLLELTEEFWTELEEEP